MHDEDDEASQYDRSKKPRGDQLVPISGPRAASGRSRSAGSAGGDEAAAYPLFRKSAPSSVTVARFSILIFSDRRAFASLKGAAGGLTTKTISRLYLPLNFGKIIETIGGDKRILAATWVMHFKLPLLLHRDFPF
jgi:hypothetical protein